MAGISTWLAIIHCGTGWGCPLLPGKPAGADPYFEAAELAGAELVPVFD